MTTLLLGHNYCKQDGTFERRSEDILHCVQVGFHGKSLEIQHKWTMLQMVHVAL